MRYPLAVLTFIFCCGIALADMIPAPFVLIYCLTAIVFIPAIFIRAYRMIFIIFLVFMLGVSGLKRSQELPACHFFKYIDFARQEPYVIKGFIADEPWQEDSLSNFRFNVEAIQGNAVTRSCCGQIIVKVKAQEDFRYGQQLILRGSLGLPFIFRRTQAHNQSGYFHNLIMRVKSAADIVKVDKNKGLKLKAFALLIKAKIQAIIYKYVAKTSAGILEAMILGEKKNIPGFISESMVKAGTIHILVVSGFNVGLVAFAIIMVLKLLRLPRKLSFLLTMPLLILYCIATGAPSPVVRATIMALVFILAQLIDRQANIYNSLSLAALSILITNSQQLFEIGFQLSFASVLGIVFLYPALRSRLMLSTKGGVYPKIKSFLRLDILKVKLLKFLLEGCLVSLSAWLGTMGLIAYYFKTFSPVTVLANLFIVPLASLITLCGFSLVAAGLFFPLFAPYLARTNELLILALVSLNNLFLRLPGAYLRL